MARNARVFNGKTETGKESTKEALMWKTYRKTFGEVMSEVRREARG